jgi:hypothetical protein
LILTLEKYFSLISQSILKKIYSNVFSNSNLLLFKINFSRGIIFLLISFTLSNCDKFNQQNSEIDPKDKKNETIPYMTIVRSSGNSLIKHADSTQEKGGIGTFLVEGDRVITERNSWIDIQYNSETLIRVFPTSSIEIKTLKKLLDKKSILSLELIEGSLYNKVFYANDSNKFIIKTPNVSSNSTGAEFIVSHSNKGSNIKVKFGKVVTYPRIFSLDDKDPMDIKPEEKNGKIATSISEKMLLLENLTEALLQLNPVFQKPLESIENIDAFTKLISEIDFASKKASFSDSEILEFNGMSLTDNKLIDDFYNITKELQSGIKDPKKIEELEGNRSSLENLLSKNNYNDYKSNTSGLEETEPKSNIKNSYSLNNNRKKWVTRTISRKLSYYKRKGKYKKLASKKVFRTPKEVHEYYERLDKLILKENRVEVGTIITQDSTLIILHTSEGIKRIPAEEVLEINFDYLRQE